MIGVSAARSTALGRRRRNWRQALALPVVAVAMGLFGLGPMAAPAVAQTAERPRAGAAASETVRGPVLIARDGQRIPTRDGWRLQGDRIVYTDERGVLTSIRRVEIDLEASRRAAEPRPPRAPAAAPAAQEAVLVLEDGDVARYRAEPATASDSGESGDGGPATSEEGSDAADGDEAEASVPSVQDRRSEALEVVSWRDLGEPATGIRLYGTIRNSGQFPVGRIHLEARVFDERGNLVLERDVRVSREPLAAAASLNFRLAIPEIRVYGSIELSATSRDVPAQAGRDR